MSYILTHSGQEVGLLDGCPTIEDIALGLSRVPRFGGQSRRRWTVAEHSLFCADIVWSTFGTCRPMLQDLRLELLVLLHDAHEALTGDVPTPFKTVGLRSFQKTLDGRIYRTLAPEALKFFSERVTSAQIVKNVDRRALLVEALRVGPPGLLTVREVGKHFGDLPFSWDIGVFDTLVDGLCNPEAAFLTRYHYLNSRIQECLSQSAP